MYTMVIVFNNIYCTLNGRKQRTKEPLNESERRE